MGYRKVKVLFVNTFLVIDIQNQKVCFVVRNTVLDSIIYILKFLNSKIKQTDLIIRYTVKFLISRVYRKQKEESPMNVYPILYRKSLHKRPIIQQYNLDSFDKVNPFIPPSPNVRTNMEFLKVSTLISISHFLSSP